MKYLRPCMAVILLIILDQFTKNAAVQYLKGTDGITCIPHIFRLFYLENRGSAFGMLQNQQTFFILFTVIVLAALVFFYTRLPETKRMLPMKIVSVLIFAGAIGNFIDRVRQSFVVDFFYFELIDFPIFNVADIYVTCAAFLLIALVLFYYKDEDFEFLKLKKETKGK